MTQSIGFYIFTLLLSLFVVGIKGQFGIGRTQQKEVVVDDGHQKHFSLDDPEFLMAIEMFSKMSPDEMEDTMLELKSMFGDDPETLVAIDEVLKEIMTLKTGDIQSSLREMISEDEVQAATFDALRMLQSTDNAWETIWEQRNAILDAVLASGQIAPADAARFRSDPKAWEAELIDIWSKLQNEVESLQHNKVLDV